VPPLNSRRPNTDANHRAPFVPILFSRDSDRMPQTQQISPGGVATATPVTCQEFPQRVNQWELVRLAAEGSLAQIYRARPAEGPADRPAPYALKMLRPEWQDDPNATGLLLREAVAGRSVSHPHLIPILAASISEPPRYVVMPWLDGSTLRAWLAAGRHLDLPVVLWIARQTAEALDALHAAGWMHGDVKPSNIFLSAEGHVTLLDLGFARRNDETGSAVDRCVMGTCNYMAPETITSALRADVRSDIYSLGIVLFEVLSGRLPFQGADLAELAEQHKTATPPDLHELAPHLPEQLVELVHRMLAKDALRRPQTPHELVRHLVKLEIATFSERAIGQ
jgi:serine/threonine protein kinase